MSTCINPILTKTSLFRLAFRDGTRGTKGSSRLFRSVVLINVCVVNKIEVRILNISTKALLRRNGYATECILWLCEIADHYHVQISLGVCAMDDVDGMDEIQLIAWYQRRGFERLFSNEMIRYPRK
jgi:hypothetical protein